MKEGMERSLRFAFLKWSKKEKYMKGSKILVADDEYLMREGIKETLLNMGCKVDLASDGEEAIRLLKGGTYSMVITDVKMPKAGGLDLLREARLICPDVPLLMMTAYGTVESAVEAMKMGAFDYILKPFSADAVEKAVKKALGGGRRRSSNRGEESIITKDKKMLRLFEIAEKVAASDATVLIQGESGTGKEVLAGFLHNKSARKDGPFIAVNCAALPENLLESELFGHERGAFTGALSKKPGKFELADKGTILLDEISEMNPLLQAKLLRVLQERVVDRVGSLRPKAVDVRVIATTNRDMKSMVAEGKFREDLFYRLNVFPLTIPPLRERVVDIMPLTQFFLEKYGSAGVEISKEAVKRLKASPWQGNVRELENIVQRALLLRGDGPILESQLFFNEEEKSGAQVKGMSPDAMVGLSVREMEKDLILSTLGELRGNRTRAADILGISVRTLRNKLNEYENCQSGSMF